VEEVVEVTDTEEAEAEEAEAEVEVEVGAQGWQAYWAVNH